MDRGFFLSQPSSPKAATTDGSRRRRSSVPSSQSPLRIRGRGDQSRKRQPLWSCRSRLDDHLARAHRFAEQVRVGTVGSTTMVRRTQLRRSAASRRAALVASTVAKLSSYLETKTVWINPIDSVHDPRHTPVAVQHHALSTSCVRARHTSRHGHTHVLPLRHRPGGDADSRWAACCNGEHHAGVRERSRSVRFQITLSRKQPSLPAQHCSARPACSSHFNPNRCS